MQSTNIHLQRWKIRVATLYQELVTFVHFMHTVLYIKNYTTLNQYIYIYIFDISREYLSISSIAKLISRC